MRLKGKNKDERVRIMANHALLIIRIGSETWFENGAKNNQPIINSIRATEGLVNQVVAEIYPIIID